MTRWSSVWLVVLGCGGGAWGQETAPLVRFETDSLLVKKVETSWRILAGTRTLKEFSRSEDAYAALRIIRELRCNQVGTIGSTRPVIEYWLSDGRAPVGLGSSRLSTVSFDLKTLKAEAKEGQWLVRDAVRPLFVFGPNEADARQALALFQQHEFNRVGYVGDPPRMMYFLARPAKDPQPGQMPAIASPRAVLPLPTLANANPFQFSIDAGEERLPIDWQNCQVRRHGPVYRLTDGTLPLAEVGISSDVAADVLRIIRHYRFTEQCRTGKSPQSFRCYLVKGQAPHGVMFGLRSDQFHPGRLTLRPENGAWVIWNHRQPLMPGGETRAEAERACASSPATASTASAGSAARTGRGFASW